MRHVASRLPTLDPDAEHDGAGASAEPKKDQNKEGADAVVVVPPTGPSEEERLEKLYEQIAWPLGKKYGNVYDAFKLSLTQVFFYFILFPPSLTKPPPHPHTENQIRCSQPFSLCRKRRTTY